MYISLERSSDLSNSGEFKKADCLTNSNLNALFSCEVVQIHNLFRHGFIKKPKSKLNLTEIENRRIWFLFDGFRKTDLITDLIANAFRGSIQNSRLFSIFSSLIFYSIIFHFKKRKGAYSCLPSNDSLNY